LGDLDVNVIILKPIIQGWDMRMCRIHVVLNAVHCWAVVKTVMNFVLLSDVSLLPCRIFLVLILPYEFMYGSGSGLLKFF
jgi:hypothetical protein